ncbi:MAG: hypothetical protein KKA73_17090 [Chloroflexi bacterium]|nr:hypothetical protein [Chloroflexota bacterium]MBU1749404.1 hypothetical protein [Chloroflexota bacterium]
MAIFDLLLIIVVLAAVATLVAVVASALRGRLGLAVKLLAMYGICLALYLGVIVVVSLASPQRILTVGEDWCFDDWCMAVEEVRLVRELGQGEQIAQADGVFYVITLRLSNHARGRPQRASSAAVHLVDGHGQRYEVTPKGQGAFEAQWGPTAPLTSTLLVGQSIRIVQVFDLPNDAHDVGLTVEHPVGPSPGLFIIGDDASLLHKPPIVRLP